jgi:hypothetical protein
MAWTSKAGPAVAGPALRFGGSAEMRPTHQGYRQSRNGSKRQGGWGPRLQAGHRGEFAGRQTRRAGGTRRWPDVGTSRPHPDFVGSLARTLSSRLCGSGAYAILGRRAGDKAVDGCGDEPSPPRFCRQPCEDAEQPVVWFWSLCDLGPKGRGDEAVAGCGDEPSPPRFCRQPCEDAEQPVVWFWSLCYLGPKGRGTTRWPDVGTSGPHPDFVGSLARTLSSRLCGSGAYAILGRRAGGRGGGRMWGRAVPTPTLSAALRGR